MFTAPGASSADGLPPDGFEAWAATRPGLPAAGIAARVWAAATRYLAYGTTAIRVHVDIGGKVGLRSVQALLARSSPCGGGTAVGAPRSLTAVRDLLQAGVPVAAGGDNLQEPTSPIGRADPLETASLLLTAARVTLAEALTAVTSAGRQIMRLPGVTVTQGSPADLVAIRAADLGSAMASGTADRIVLRGGRIVARGLTATELGLLELHITRSAWNLVGFLPGRLPSGDCQRHDADRQNQASAMTAPRRTAGARKLTLS